MSSCATRPTMRRAALEGVAAFHDRGNRDAVKSAVLLDDDDVLRPSTRRRVGSNPSRRSSTPYQPDPCGAGVEMKYCSTDRPSRKLAVIGVSMTSPEGLDMSPRIPASCRTCSLDPRAPESAMM